MHNYLYRCINKLIILFVIPFQTDLVYSQPYIHSFETIIHYIYCLQQSTWTKKNHGIIGTIINIGTVQKQD